MATILNTKSIYFNDVNLIPSRGVLESRSHVPDERFRIIVSPMPAVVGRDFVVEAAKNNLSIALPRVYPISKQIELYKLFYSIATITQQKCFVSLKLKFNDNDDLHLIKKANIKNILIDMANGYVPQISKQILQLNNSIGGVKNLMIGNITTLDGARYIQNATKKYCQNVFIRVGIGNGGPCATSDVTGINRGQITELIEICESDIIDDNTFIVSDGGIVKGGNAVKAWAAGADYVLMGSYFAEAKEAETHISGDGTYYGCASKKHIELEGVKRHSEGKINKVDKNNLQSLEYLTSELWGGIRSAVSYLGYRSLNDIIGNGTFEIKQNSLPPKKKSMIENDLLLAISLLKIAKCPNCDGSGGIPRQTSSRLYVTKEMAMDAGAPEMEGSLFSDEEWELEQCQWCDEKEQLLKDVKKIKYNVKQIYPQIYLVTSNPWDLAMIFFRAQEFYENVKYKNKTITIWELMRHFASDNIFSYADDYRGYNLPSKSIDAFLKCRLNELSPWDIEFNAIIKNIKLETKQFYLIGVQKGDNSALEHELAHAFYSMYPEYRQSMDNLIKKCFNKKKIQKICKELKSLGYHSSVMNDEIQAYSVDNEIPDSLECILGSFRGQFRAVFLKYKNKK